MCQALAGAEVDEADVLLKDLLSLEELPQYQAVAQVFRTTLSQKSPAPILSNGRRTSDFRIVLENLGHDCGERMDHDGDWDEDYIQEVVSGLAGRLTRLSI